MGLFIKVTITIDSAHTVPQRSLDCGPGLGGLNQVYGPNCPNPSENKSAARTCMYENSINYVISVLKLEKILGKSQSHINDLTCEIL